MDHVTNSFFEATRWNRDNSYSELNATTNGSLPCPHASSCPVLHLLTLWLRDRSAELRPSIRAAPEPFCSRNSSVLHELPARRLWWCRRVDRISLQFGAAARCCRPIRARATSAALAMLPTSQGTGAEPIRFPDDAIQRHTALRVHVPSAINTSSTRHQTLHT
jgi:hypothetical protein